MTDRKPSQTAAMIAAYRAQGTRGDRGWYADPWAAGLAGAEGDALREAMDAIYPAMQLWVDIRTAYLDGLVRRYLAAPRSFRQVVILGAGLDTRAARLAHEGVAFYEVDQPASQTMKRERLASLDGYPAAAATFVSCDFERESAVSALGRSAFDFMEPAVVLWEGVTPYLVEAAVRTTVRAIAESCHEDTVLAFDYLSKRKHDAKSTRKDTQEFVADLGEPVVWGTNDVLPILFEEGMRSVATASFDDLCLALTGTYERAREFRFQRIAVASRRVRRFAMMGDPA